MADIYSFKGLRTPADKTEEIACVPYDVVDEKEARECIEKHPLSFMRVSRSDSIMPEYDAKDPAVYAQAKKTFEEMISSGLFTRDETPSIYIYRADYGHAVYTGFVANASVKDYENNVIKRHELTRYDKEEDRTTHIDTTNAHTGLVILLYRDEGSIDAYIRSLIEGRKPCNTATGDTGVRHDLFRISDEAEINKLIKIFKGVDALYIADGHHRAKSSVNVAQRRRAEGRITPESEKFMAVFFAENTVRIHGYSRLCASLENFTEQSFLAELAKDYTVTEYGAVDSKTNRIVPKVKSDKPVHVFHIYMNHKWYEISHPVKNPEDTIGSLDVSDIQENILGKLLNITDPRGDKRLSFMGGSYPLADLMAEVDSGKNKFAISVQPVEVKTVLKVADEGLIMPPKSTWFEPKVLSGLVVHTLD